MIENIKLLLGDAAINYSDALIELQLTRAVNEIEAYCNRKIDDELLAAAEEIAVIKLLRQNTEGLSSQGFSGISESYIDGYPSNITAILDRKRKIKIVG